jgi:diguanylate cyclase (GGDEF)-like protein
MCFILDVSERRAAQIALRKAYDELELRVEQRTQDLKEEIERRRHAEEALRQLSLTDALTGLYNRRGFLMRAEQQMQIARRENRALYLFMMDLDGLKPINDTYGHLEGDQAIKECGAILKSNFRAVDVVARIGGDEFAVLMVDDASQKPEESLQRLKERLDEHHRLHGRAYRLSLSVGMAITEPQDTFNLDQLISRADATLYEEKRQKSSRHTSRTPSGEKSLPIPPQAT